jgi:hypothetical protein
MTKIVMKKNLPVLSFSILSCFFWTLYSGPNRSEEALAAARDSLATLREEGTWFWGMAENRRLPENHRFSGPVFFF